jgi:hypothetical protein
MDSFGVVLGFLIAGVQEDIKVISVDLHFPFFQPLARLSRFTPWEAIGRFLKRPFLKTGGDDNERF